jgi:hypothetical protein
MSHYIEHDRLVIVSSLVGYDRAILNRLDTNATSFMSLINADIYLAAINGGDNNIIDTLTNKPLRGWSVLAAASTCGKLLDDIAYKTVRACTAGSFRVRGKEIKASSYLAKYEKALECPKYVCPETFADAMVNVFILPAGLKAMEHCGFGESCKSWINTFDCFTHTEGGVLIGKPKTPEESVAIFGLVHWLSWGRERHLNFSSSTAATQLSNALSYEPPTHLRPVLAC